MKRPGNYKIPLNKLTKKGNPSNNKNEEDEIAKVYKEFEETFSESSTSAQSWVRGGVVNPGSSAQSIDASKIYKPLPKCIKKLEQKEKVFPVMKTNRPFAPGKDKTKAQKKSNLELFKEELKKMQEQREQRQQLKQRLHIGAIEAKAKIARAEGIPYDPNAARAELMLCLDYNLENESDTSTTNIFLGNLNPKTTEQNLCELFGRYGPLASVKIMWPRTEEQRAVGKNCGFVAFMNRLDSERAMTNLRGKDFHGFEMKLGWGKSVILPFFPVYIPPTLLEWTKPPKPSGLPFNAQPREWLKQAQIEHKPFNVDDFDNLELETILQDSVVKVVIPSDRSVVAIIHRMIEFLIYYGPSFESAIMHKENHNNMFRFLFDFQSPEHVYYRWRLWSLLHGESASEWSTDEFKMFENGPWWKPPPVNLFTAGMPEELIDYDDLSYFSGPNKEMLEEQREEPQSGGAKLTDNQKQGLIKMLWSLEPAQSSVGEVMLWCLDHADASNDVIDVLLQSMDPSSSVNAPIHVQDDAKPPALSVPRVIARLYLISDILYNSGAKIPKAAFFRKAYAFFLPISNEFRLEVVLPSIFKHLQKFYSLLDGKVKCEQMKQKVMLCFRAWEDWAVYPNEFLIQLQNIFLGLFHLDDRGSSALDGETLQIFAGRCTIPQVSEEDPDLDGTSLVNYDIDDSGDVDGSPLEQPISRVITPREEPKRVTKPPITMSQLFMPSKWESVEPSVLAKEAITTASMTKWDRNDLAEGSRNRNSGSDDELDGMPLRSGFSLVAYDDRDINSPPPA
ncbi:U2 snRNP-associated SURP domain-containing protein [Cichlidogyrus casuarinus]|uniref:U2 snRNP-associated SURP domain-containing protein n=1 Tax=Cichlidogyrus casuarinus TaxID=1844966 RepID=A0ABD2Q6H5_9PLAT